MKTHPTLNPDCDLLAGAAGALGTTGTTANRPARGKRST